MFKIIIIVFLMVSSNLLRAQEEIVLYVNSWIFTPLNKYTKEDIVNNHTLKIQSVDFAFIEEMKKELKLNSLVNCSSDKDSSLPSINVVIKLINGMDTHSFISDGRVIVDFENKKCGILETHLKKILDPLSLLKNKAISGTGTP